MKEKEQLEKEVLMNNCQRWTKRCYKVFKGE